ncbi:MAG: alcohol dehydrogenase catalytic domain-containing protein [Chloroflexota bacterium]|jgi:threonine dehydrogenase-like Zn-dependent dehydrogenase
MDALCLENGQLRLRTDYPNPQPGPGEALIAVSLAGICATDLELVKGYLPFTGVLGHEFVGVVTAVGSPAQDAGWMGRRVVGTINLGCGSCPVCLADGPEQCARRTVLGIAGKDGAFAHYLTLPVTNLLPVPDDVSDEQAVFTEPLAAALRIREQVQVRPTARMAVVGPGRLGLLVGQVLALDGGQVTMLGRSPASLELPARLGLQTGLATDFGDEWFDFVVEATGNEAGFAQSLRLVRPRGTLVLKSTFAGAATLNLTKLVVAEINVIGSRCGPFAPALRLLAGHDVDVLASIEAQYPLRDALVAVDHAARAGVRKVLLQVGSE